MHKGHAFSALTGAKLAGEMGGQFILRIEDIDLGRCRPQFETAIYEDLAWLGLDWQKPVRQQSDHFGDYQSALTRLRDRGLVYRCFKTRQEVLADIGRAPHGRPDAWRGQALAAGEEAARLAAGEVFAWRLSIESALAFFPAAAELTYLEAGDGVEAGLRRVDLSSTGDVVLARKDVGVAYHLAVVVDDALQGVTDVVRGADLVEATPVQRLLQTLLGLPTPRYHHHRLIAGPDGKRFAKRDQSITLRALREAGVTASQVKAELGF